MEFVEIVAATSEPQVVASSSEPQPSTSEPQPSAPTTPVPCAICWDLFLPDELWVITACDGEHAYCRECLKQHFCSQINDANVSDLCCPHPDCRAAPTEQELKMLVPREVFKKYLDFVVLAVVRNNPEYRWCPVPVCSRALKVDLTLPSAQCAQCKFRFCISCSSPAHEGPCTFILTEMQKEIAKWASTLGAAAVKAWYAILLFCKISLSMQQYSPSTF